MIERGAGAEAGFPDAAYVDKGARVAAGRSRCIFLRRHSAGPRRRLPRMRAGQVVDRYGRSARLSGNRARALVDAASPRLRSS